MKTRYKIFIAVIATLDLLYFGAGLLLAGGKTLEERHQPFAHTPFDYTGTYADYMTWSRALVAAARTDNPSQQVITNLSPFEFIPGPECARDASGKVDKGIVLTHGLFESAYSMRPLGEALRARCLHVYGLLLPAHGTRPGDFLETEWEEWTALLRFATARMAEQANVVLLGGHSAGGALSLLEAHSSPQAEALILFAPALAITPSARFAKFVTPLGMLFPGAAWVGVDNDEAVYRYESITFTAAAEIHAMIQRTHELITAQRRQLPVFAVVSQEDTTVDADTTLAYMAGNSHPLSRTLLYSQHPVAAVPRVEVVNSNQPGLGILSLSHLGLMVPPGDPHYGIDGAYKSCGHYGDADNPQFVACKNGARDFYGETTAENRAQAQVLERIAFNPFYDDMLVELDEFLASLDD